VANVLSLALKVTADASGLKLDPVQRALVNLGNEADKLTGQFAQFAAGSEAAAAAQESFAKRSQDLINSLRDNGNATQFAADYERLAGEARELAAAFEEGARVTASVRTEEEKRGTELERLAGLLEKNAITEETYNRAVAEASGSNREAARVAAEAAQQQAEAERSRAAAVSRASAIIQANLSPQERYRQSLAELRSLQQQGLLTQEQFNRAVASARRPLEDAAAAAGRAAQANAASTLRFNELSGALAILPGPLGNIAGRLSGLSSAGEGLSRVFAGGLSQGVSSVASSFGGLIASVNPAVLAIAGIGAAATGIVRGLVSLEDRVERLGNLADQLGVSFQFVQVLEETGRRTGVSLEGVASAMSRLQRTLAGADEESKKATKALQNLGLSVTDLEGLTEQGRIEVIGQQLAAIEDPAKRSAAAIELFGRSGVQLLPFFRQLGTTADDVQRLGGALSDLDRANLDTLGRSLDAISRATIRLGELVLLPFTGFVTDVSDSLADLIGFVNRVVEIIGRGLKPVIDALGASFKILGFLLQQVNKGIDFVFGTAKASADAAKKATADARKELEKPLNTGPARDLEQAFSNVDKSLRSSIGLVGIFGDRASSETIRFSRELDVLATKFDTSTAGGLKAYTRAVAEATENYNQQIGAIRAAQVERQRLLESERNVADTLLEQLRIQREFGGDNQRAQAANNVLVIEREIARAQALGPGNEAAKERIRLLQEALAVQQGLADGSTQQADADRKRIEALTQQTDRQSEVERNILAIKREQERVQIAIGEAAFGDSDAAFRAAQQQEEQLQRILAEQETLLQAQEQGFGEGFDKAFEATAKGFDGVIEKAAEFGKAGFDAAAQLQEGIARAQEQARDGILNREAYEQEVARQQELFDKQLADIKALADERQRVNEFVDQQIELARFGGDQRRLQASQNAAALEAEIARVTAEVTAARAAGDQAAANAGIERLAQLDQAAAKENDIASGKAAEREAQRKFLDDQAKAAQQQQQQAQQRQQQIQQEQQRIFEEQAKAAAAEAERQQKRIRALNSIGQQSISTGDLRSSQGASAFVQAAAGAFDPNLAQQRAQTKLLQKIATNSGALQYLERGIGQSVAILRGGA
jgi:hypothetical protein